jgi:ABC-type glutathione transport system ATPase component
LALLKVENLIIKSKLKKGRQCVSKFSPIIGPISLELEEGTITALLGNSGSGKTLFARSIIGLLPRGLYISEGKIFYRGKPIRAREFAKLRGQEIFYLPQDASASLNPVQKIYMQISEALEEKISRSKLIEMLETLNIKRPELVLESFPFQLSGGENQRCILAMALLRKPGLLILDEPTSAIDLGARDKFVELLLKIKNAHNLTILIISHDLDIIEKIASRKYTLKKFLI